MKLTLQQGEAAHDVRVLRNGEQLSVTFGDGRALTARLSPLGDGRLLLEHDGRRLVVAGASLGRGARQLWLAGRTLSYRVAQPGARQTHGDATATTASTIPAVVREILVAPGELVTIGQRLLLLESMKMVLPIVAPHAGRVRAIVCAVGEAVAPGVPLVELEDS